MTQPKKPIHSLPEKIDMGWSGEVDTRVLADKLNQIINHLSSKEK